MSAIFGGSKSKQQSVSNSVNQSSSENSNQAYPQLLQEYGTGAGTTNEALSAINALFGGDNRGFNTYRDATGYNTEALNLGRGVAASGAAAGLLNSGATGKALMANQSALDQRYADSYLDQLYKKSNLGLNIGQLISGAGGKSSSSSYGTSTGNSSGNSTGKNGMGDFLGGLAGGIAASDRRLKKDINHIYTLPDGLKVYQFVYNNTSDDGIQIGVMADEVAELRPHALGPIRNGYATVNYDYIWE